MRITNVRGGRLIKICACVFVIVPILYLLVTWSDGANKLGKAIQHAKLHSQSTGNEVPKLIEGLYFFLFFVCITQYYNILARLLLYNYLISV